MNFHDRLKFTTAGTSAASLSDGAAVANCRNIARTISDTSGATNALVIGSQITLTIDDGAGNWEDSLFTVGGTTSAPTLTRTQVLSSSAGGTAAATFTGATLTVFNSPSGKILSRASIDSDIAFTQSVPLAQVGTAWMTQQTVNGALTFNPAANPVKGASAYAMLIADGASSVTAPGFTERIGSAGYDNRNGILNIGLFEYDGLTSWITWSQANNAVPVASALTLNLSAASSNVGSAITVTVGTNQTLTGSQTESVTLSAPVAGTWSQNPVTLNASTATAAPTFTPSAVGSGYITATASGTPTVSSTSSAYSATTAGSETLTVNTPATQTVGTAYNVTGTYANATPGALDYSIDGGTTWTAASSPTISGGTFSFSVTPTTASASRTMMVRDHTNTSATATSGTYVVNAAPSETISVTTPGAQVAGTAFTLAGTYANGTPTALDYSLDGTTWTAAISPTISGGNFSFSLTIASANASQTVKVRDHTNTSVIGTSGAFAVNASVSYPRLNQLSSTTTESGTGPYTYTGGGTAFASEKGGVTTTSLPAGGDGYLQFVILNATDSVEVGFRGVDSTNVYSSQTDGFYTTAGSGAVPAAYRHIGEANSGVTPQAGDVLRVGRRNTSTSPTLYMAVQRNGTGAWTDVATVSSASTAQFWFDVVCAMSTSVQLTASSGLS